MIEREAHLFKSCPQCRNFLRYVVVLIVEYHAKQIIGRMQICASWRKAAGLINEHADFFDSYHVLPNNTKARIAPRLRQESFPHPGDSDTRVSLSVHILPDSRVARKGGSVDFPRAVKSATRATLVNVANVEMLPVPVLPVTNAGGAAPAAARVDARPPGFAHSTHGSATNGKAIVSPSAQRAAVLQGAPHARPQGRALAKCLAKRFQKRRGHRHGERGVKRFRLPFTPNGL